MQDQAQQHRIASTLDRHASWSAKQVGVSSPARAPLASSPPLLAAPPSQDSREELLESLMLYPAFKIEPLIESMKERLPCVLANDGSAFMRRGFKCVSGRLPEAASSANTSTCMMHADFGRILATTSFDILWQRLVNIEWCCSVRVKGEEGGIFCVTICAATSTHGHTCKDRLEWAPADACMFML